MIRTIEHIKGSGFFQDFRWDRRTPPFQRLTLIYGPNGSGKSSLATALLAAKNDDPVKRPDLKLTEDSDIPFTDLDRLFIFSRAYVDANYRLNSTDALTPSIITVGKKSIEEQQEIEQIQAALPTLQNEVTKAANRQKTANQSFETVKRTVREQVNAALSTVSSDYQSNKFRADTVAKRYSSDRSSWLSLTPNKLQAALQYVKSPAPSVINYVPWSTSQVTDGLKEEAGSLLQAEPISVVLDTLATHPQAASWVQTGIGLHTQSETCLFCGNPFTEERRRQIADHFSAEVQNTAQQIQALIDSLTQMKQDVQAAQADIQDCENVEPSVRSSYSTAVDILAVNYTEILDWCTDLIKRLQRKAQQIVGYTDTNPVPELPQIDTSGIDQAIQEHNTLVRTHEQEQQQTSEKIVNHYLYQHQAEYDAAQTEMHDAKRSVEDANAAFRKAQSRLAELTQSKGSIVSSAEYLTSEVARLLGRHELTFIAKDSDRYEIQRAGQPACGLSEGEKTATTLVHFLETVRRWDSPTGKRPIVVIDDPVSSLDHGVFMGISSALWSLFVQDDTDTIEQMILLTHDFEFFRQWDTQFDYLPSSLRGKKPCNRCTLELTSGYTEPVHQRKPQLIAWPPSEEVRKKVRSAYHHAFLRLIEAQEKLQQPNSTIADRLEAQLLFPNIIRRVLESFLAFKFPGNKGTLSTLMAACKEPLRQAITARQLPGYVGDADSLRHDLMRFSNTYSHDINPEITALVSPEEVLPAITSLFMFMSALDHTHYEGMCEAVGKTPALSIDPHRSEGAAA